MHRSSQIAFYIALALATPALAYHRRNQESADVNSSNTQTRRCAMYDYNARSFNTGEHLSAAANPNKYDPDASNALKQYTDPTAEPTISTNDGLGRPVRRDYADGTFEEIHYDGERTDTVRDRQGRMQKFNYDDAGGLFEVTSSGVVLDHLDFENGRVVRWKTPDASTEFSDFDADNHPQQITQHRLDANGNEIDSYTIAHSWNAAGELIHTGMPSYQGMPGGGRWTSSLDYHYDANGNVMTILRNGSALLDATYRGAGRPLTRDVTLPNGAKLARAYDYDDQSNGVGATVRHARNSRQHAVCRFLHPLRRPPTQTRATPRPLRWRALQPLRLRRPWPRHGIGHGDARRELDPP
jgi:hypothetical protein